MSLSQRDINTIIGMLNRGDRQSDIAAWFGINAGRVAEINLKYRQGVRKLNGHDGQDLPPPGPYIVSARSAHVAEETLLALRDLIDDALRDLQAPPKADGHDPAQ